MGWPSYAENIIEIGCDLEHIAYHSPNAAELDPVAELYIRAAAERMLSQIYEALEVATDPNLDLGCEVTRWRACSLEYEKQQRLDKERIDRLLRDVEMHARETAYWRDQCINLPRRNVKARRRRPPCRQH